MPLKKAQLILNKIMEELDNSAEDVIGAQLVQYLVFRGIQPDLESDIFSSVSDIDLGSIFDKKSLQKWYKSKLTKRQLMDDLLSLHIKYNVQNKILLIYKSILYVILDGLKNANEFTFQNLRQKLLTLLVNEEDDLKELAVGFLERIFISLKEIPLQ